MVADLNMLGPVGDLYCFSNTLSMLVDFDFFFLLYNAKYWHRKRMLHILLDHKDIS